MKTKLKLLSTSMAAAVAASAFSVTTFAQENVIEEIIVTANKREESLSDIAFSIQALTENELSNKGVESVRDLVNVVPGLSAQSTFSEIGGAVSLRAVRSIVGHDSTVGFYFDEAPVTYLGYGYTPTTDVFDLERLEVLKGPQGTLYGASSMSGAIKIITKDPDASAGFGGAVQVSANTTRGGDETYSGDIALNLPIVEDVLAARVVYGKRDVGGYIDDGSAGAPLGENINTKDFETVRAKLKFTPNDRLTVEALYWETEAEDILGNTVESEDPEDLLILAQGGQVTTYDSDLETISLSASYDLGSVIVEYAYSNSDIAAPLDFRQGGIVATGATTTEQDTHELRFVSSSDEPFQWIGGFFYRDAERPSGLAVSFPFAPGGPSFSTPFANTTLTSESYAVFGEFSYEVNNWTFLVGGRYFTDDRTGVTTTDALEGALNPADPFGEAGPNFALLSLQEPGPFKVTESNEQEFNEFSPKINIKYNFENGNMAYFNAAKGFRSGFLNFGILKGGVAAVGLNPADFEVIDPDTLWSYELGSKGLLGESTSYDVAVYYTDWNNLVQQIQSGGPNPLGLLANIGDAEIYGIEFAFTWNTSVEGLSITARGNFMDSEVDLDPGFEGSVQFEATEYGSLGDGKVSAISHENANLSVDYVTDISSSIEMSLNATAIYRGAQSDAYAIRERTTSTGAVVSADSEDHTLLNLNATFASEAGWSATLFVHNVFDEIYRNSTFDGRLFGVNPPRQIGVTLGYDF